MARKARPPRKSASRSLTIRLDAESKTLLSRAAELRRISMSEYLRAIAVPQARREVAAARRGIIALSAAEQLAFWRALKAPAKLTPAQRRLGKLMRGG
ncbi:MAG TPA: DUF1778 domain-containing protein [Pirellulales bacterium]